MPIDYKKYPPNWKAIVNQIAIRSGNQCEFCGLKNKQPVWSVKLYIRNEGKYRWQSIWFRNEQDAIRESNGHPIKKIRVVLTTAHLDHDETNIYIKLNRLVHLCQICHLRYDAEEKYQRAIKKGKK